MFHLDLLVQKCHFTSGVHWMMLLAAMQAQLNLRRKSTPQNMISSTYSWRYFRRSKLEQLRVFLASARKLSVSWSSNKRANTHKEVV